MNIKKSDLLKILVPLSKVATTTGLPCTTCIYLHGNGERLILRASDIQQYIEGSLEFKPDLDACLVPAHRFVSAINFCGDELSLQAKEGRLFVQSGAYKAEFATMETTEFPAPPKIPVPIKDAPCLEISNAIDITSWAASVEEWRYVLNSSHLIADGTTITIESNTGREMCCYCLPSNIQNMNLVIPRKSAPTLAQGLKQEKAAFAFDERRAYAVWSNGWYSCSLVEGNYPSTKEIILGRDRKAIGSIARDEWLLTFRAIVEQLNTDPKAGIKTLVTFTTTEAFIESESKEQKFQLSMLGNFEPNQVCMNAKPMVQALNSFESGSALELFAEEFGPIVLKNGKITTFSQQMRA